MRWVACTDSSGLCPPIPSGPCLLHIMQCGRGLAQSLSILVLEEEHLMVNSPLPGLLCLGVWAAPAPRIPLLPPGTVYLLLKMIHIAAGITNFLCCTLFYSVTVSWFITLISYVIESRASHFTYWIFSFVVLSWHPLGVLVHLCFGGALL